MTDKITLEKIFTRAWQRFIVEKSPASTGPFYGCRYVSYDEKGKRLNCAVGLAFTEEQLDIIQKENLNSSSVDIIIKKYPQWFNERVSEKDFLNTQFILHDDLVSLLGKEEQLYYVEQIYINYAKEYDFVIPSES